MNPVFCFFFFNFNNDKMDFPFIEFRKHQEEHIWGKIKSVLSVLSLECLQV